LLDRHITGRRACSADVEVDVVLPKASSFNLLPVKGPPNTLMLYAS